MSGFPESLEIPVGKRTFKYRFFEMLPGILTYTTLLLPVILSLIDRTSRLAALFVLAFLFSWFYRAVGTVVRVFQGYQRMEESSKIDWPKALSDLEDSQSAIERLEQAGNRLGKSQKQHLINLSEYVKDPELHDLKPSDMLQFVIVPMWQESYEVVQPTIQSLKDSRYDPKKLIVVIAYEERGGRPPEAVAERLVKEFKGEFRYIEAIKHIDQPNEVVGKGGNITWAAKQMEQYFITRKIDPCRVMVTTLDCDNKPDPDYFSHLAYSYILTRNRKHYSYQPIAVYTNNIWDVPAPMRVLAVGNTLFTVVQSVRPHILRNFSTHGQSLDALMETGYWSTRTIVEDGHQYWRSYFAFKGDYGVVPIYRPIYQDAVLSDKYTATLKDQFTQFQRWSYGASDIAYMANIGFRGKKDRLVPLGDFLAKFLRLLDTHVSWGSAPLLLLLAARAPLFIGPHADKSIVAHQLPIIASYAQTLAMIGLFVSIFLSFKILPPRPKRYKKGKWVLMLLQWIFIPVVSIIYGAFAALNSQTHLLFGRYLNKFKLTHKGQRSRADD